MTELLDNDLKYRPPHVTFTPADVVKYLERLNLIGKLNIFFARVTE